MAQTQCPNCGIWLDIVQVEPPAPSGDGSMDFSDPEYSGLLVLLEDI